MNRNIGYGGREKLVGYTWKQICRTTSTAEVETREDKIRQIGKEIIDGVAIIKLKHRLGWLCLCLPKKIG